MASINMKVYKCIAKGRTRKQYENCTIYQRDRTTKKKKKIEELREKTIIFNFYKLLVFQFELSEIL